jgi:hypothetical protein
MVRWSSAAGTASASCWVEHGSIIIDGAGQLSVDLGPFPAPENSPDSF